MRARVSAFEIPTQQSLLGTIFLRSGTQPWRKDVYRGTSLIGNSPPSQDNHRALDMSLLQGPREGLFLIIEVLLYCRVLGNGDCL